MLGPFTVVLDFLTAHPLLTSAILATWGIIYYAGRVQLKIIEAKTIKLIVSHCRILLVKDSGISATDLYSKIFPIWVQELKTWQYLFIPNKYDLWPVPVTVENVLVKIPISPRWISAILDKMQIS
jgi:hypothetical protein